MSWGSLPQTHISRISVLMRKFHAFLSKSDFLNRTRNLYKEKKIFLKNKFLQFELSVIFSPNSKLTNNHEYNFNNNNNNKKLIWMLRFCLFKWTIYLQKRLLKKVYISQDLKKRIKVGKKKCDVKFPSF